MPGRPLGERAFSLVLAALIGMTALSIDMSLPAMPQLQRVFGADVAAVQLTLSLFLLGFAAGQMVCGPLSDSRGRRPVLLAGLAAFTVAGLACSVSPSLPVLIAMRFLQGMGASVGPVLARAMIRDHFPPTRTAAVLSQMTQVMILAPLIAPTVGGYLLVWFGWPAIFLVLGVCGLLLWLVCWRRLPETLKEPYSGDGQAQRLWQGLRSVLAHRSGLRHALIVCLSHAGLFAYISGSPFVLMDAFHVPRQRFGFFFALTAAALLVGATVNRMLLSRQTPAAILRLGVLLLFASGTALVGLAWLRLGGLAGVLVPMMAYLFGLGLVQPNATAAAMAPHGRLAGVTSSLIGALQTTGGAAAGYCVGAFYDHTSLSLAVTVAALALLTLLVFLLEMREESAAEARKEEMAA